MYLQIYEALCRSFFVVVELKAALNVVFSAAKEGWLYASGTIRQRTVKPNKSPSIGQFILLLKALSPTP
jgi:hypothetical protein